MDWERIYRDLSHLLQTTPTNLFDQKFENRQWMARAYALVAEVDLPSAAAEFKTAQNQIIEGRSYGDDALKTIIMRAWAVAERNAPASVSGSFIPAGASFDAFAAVAKVLKTAKSDALIVDPYMDETVLDEYGKATPDGVTLRLLSDAKTCKPSLGPAVKRWVQQYPGRPVLARLAPERALHDRAIFIDRNTAWTVTQSLKDLANRSSASILRADDIAAMKIAAYEEVWSKATPIG